MSAVFGKLQGQTPELQDGLNIIQAPNESGKSTWCAFLLAMLYGINSRERDKAGSIADKNRYAPWSGSAMSGRLDLFANNRSITLLRSTKRSGAPMAEFQAVYSDTANPVPGLTAENCGESLFGISRDVYARSAFIRQNGLPITQSAELERRIISLISSGNDGPAFSEATDILKKQLNQRRHNKSGQIPLLETELQLIYSQTTEANSLSSQIALLRQQEEQLAAQENTLRQELDQCIAWKTRQQSHRLSETSVAADEALRHADNLRRQLEADRIPENDTIARLRGALVNLSTTRHNLEKARTDRDNAMKVFLQAEAAVNNNPFAGQTPEQVRREVSEPPKHRVNGIPIILGIYGTAAIIAAPLYLLMTNLPDRLGFFFIGVPLILISALASNLLVNKRRKKAQTAALTKHFGTTNQSEIAAMADTYLKLLENRDAAQAELDRLTSAADTLYNSISSNEQAILLEIRRFAPLAYDLSTADALLRGCAIRRKELSTAEQAARSALALQDTTAKELQAEFDNIPAPTRSETDLTVARQAAADALSTCRANIQHVSGRLSAIGDAAQLHKAAEATETRLATLRTEYVALQLAIDTLDHANQTLQQRFAPALGQRTAELFHRLTDGHYKNVVLDRSLHLSAEPEGDPLYRDIALLSAGAADQLYLAARLAISETVLPADKNPPLILDDALINFDDERCAIALKLLKDLAQHRQILLFTCHNREAAFFADDEDVTILRLTNDGEKV